MINAVFLSLLAASPVLSAAIQSQSVFEHPEEGPYFDFGRKLERVAVIGAGAAGLVSTAILQDHNLTVRTFERAPKPGGNWYYSEETPV